MPIRRVFVSVLLVGAVLAGAASAKTITAAAGNVSAAFSYSGSFGHYKHLHLKIVRAGAVAYDQAVSSAACAAPDCGPLAFGSHAAVSVVDLNLDGQPEVVLSLYSGGAHCCEVDQVFSFDPGTATYVLSEHDFGNAGATLRSLASGGRPLFVSADNAFYYAFASYAASGAPIQIWSFGSRRFHDVTRQHRRQIAGDARHWWGAFTHHLADGEGLIAAWAADQELLGHSKLVRRTLARQARKGHLHSDQAPSVPTGKRFPGALLRFLHKHGYGR